MKPCHGEIADGEARHVKREQDGCLCENWTMAIPGDLPANEEVSRGATLGKELQAVNKC